MTSKNYNDYEPDRQGKIRENTIFYINETFYKNYDANEAASNPDVITIFESHNPEIHNRMTRVPKSSGIKFLRLLNSKL